MRSKVAGWVPRPIPTVASLPIYGATPLDVGPRNGKGKDIVSHRVENRGSNGDITFALICTKERSNRARHLHSALTRPAENRYSCPNSYGDADGTSFGTIQTVSHIWIQLNSQG